MGEQGKGKRPCFGLTFKACARVLTRAPWRAVTLWPVAVGAVAGVALLAISSLQPTTSQAAVSATPTIVRSSRAADPVVAALAAALKPAHLKAKVRQSALTPSVASLVQDRFNMGSCDPGSGDATSASICHWGDTSGSKTMVVFGDSQAKMWMLPLTNYAAANGWQLIPIEKPGCVSQFWTGASGETAACKGWFEWATNEVKQLSPDAIVFATYYSFTDQGMAIGIKTLAALAPKLVVLQDPLHLPVEPTDCLLAAGATYGSCTFVASRKATLADAAVQHDARAAGAAFIPTRQWFCLRGMCPMVIGSTIAYSDHDHISQEYARFLRVPLSKALASALG